MKLRTLILATVIAALVGVSFDCDAKKKKKDKDLDPFGEGTELPCTVYDNANQYAATGTAYGSFSQLHQLKNEALQNARAQIKQKLKRAFTGTEISNNAYASNRVATGSENFANEKLDGEINAILNDLQEVCAKRGKVDEKGNLTYFVGIIVDKKLVDQVFEKTPEEVRQQELDAIRDRAMKARSEQE